MVLECVLQGNLAVWAKNSSNFEKISSDIPPRSAIIGMFGRISGIFDKKELNDFFSDEKSKIAVTPIHTGHLFISGQNYIHEDNFNDYRGMKTQKKSKQRPVGQLVPNYHLGYNNIVYKIYLYHENKEYLRKIYDIIKNKRYASYCPYMGASDYTGMLLQPILHEKYRIKNNINTINTVCKNNFVKDISVNTEYMVECLQRYTNEHYYAEQLTYYYYTDNMDTNPLVGSFEGEFIELENGKIITWM